MLQTGFLAPGHKRNKPGTIVPLFYPACGIKQPPALRMVVDTASSRKKIPFRLSRCNHYNFKLIDKVE
jgi:hypothetical protein